MGAYEEYLKEKLKDAETKIESLYLQLSIEQEECAKYHIENRQLKEYKAMYEGLCK